jgi:hypothetical protein
MRGTDYLHGSLQLKHHRLLNDDILASVDNFLDLVLCKGELGWTGFQSSIQEGIDV